MFNNPIGYAGYPPGVTGTATNLNTTVRAATAAEAAAGTLTDCYISPATAQSATSLDFASPPVLGFGSTTKRPVAATTLVSTGSSTIATTGATVNTFGNSNASTTNTFTAGAAVLTMTNTGANYPAKLTNTAPAAGFIGEQITQTKAKGSAVALSTGASSNITSISLTPGVWDVSASCCMTGGAITGTIFEAAISQTTAALGTIGVDDFQTPDMATATCDATIAIPPVRILLSATTSVYLVANVTYSVGAATGYGHISATRVA